MTISSNRATIFIGVFFVLLVGGAQLLPFLKTVEGKQYLGIPYNVVDTNNYLSFMEQARSGKLLFTNKFTSEEIPYIFAQPVFLIVGWFTFIFPPVLVYFLFKILFLVLFCYWSLRFLRRTVTEKELPFAYAFLLFGSGIGYLSLLLKKGPSIDLWVSATNSVNLNIAPLHFVVSVFLMLAIIHHYERFWETKGKGHLHIVMVSTLFLGFTHLFDLITLAPVIAVYLFWRLKNKKDSFKKIIRHNVLYVLLALIPFLYTLYIFGINPLFKEWNAQNVLPTPNILYVVMGYFLPLLLSILYMMWRWKNEKPLSGREVVLFTWLIAGFILMYSPFNIQRRFIEGLHIPIMILGALGFCQVFLPWIQKVVSQEKKLVKTTSIIVLFLLITPTSLFWVYKVNADVSPKIRSGDFTGIPYYLDVDELEAFEWLKENTNKDDIVFSSYAIGNYIPRYSGNRVFLGHWAQTIDFEEKKKIVHSFYQSQDESFIKDTTTTYNIKYIYYGPHEQQIGKFFPRTPQIVFRNENVLIYKAP